MKRKFLQNNHLIKLFGVLFMTLNLIIVVIGSISYVYTLNVFKQSIYEQNVSTIENVKTLMDIRLDSIEKLAQDIYLSVNLSELIEKDNLQDTNSRYILTKLIDSIDYGVNTNYLVTTAYVYLSKSDSIVSNTGFYDAQFFYENYVPQKSLDFFEWKNSLVAHDQPYYKNTILSYEKYDTNVIQYIKPFNIYASDVYGCIIINYDNQAISDILTKGNLLSNASTQLTYRPEGKPLISSGNSDINLYLEKKDIKVGQTILQNTPFGNLMVLKSTSVNGDWDYLSAIPTNIFYRSTNTLIVFMIAIVILQIVLGALLALLFSKRSYQPIKHMTVKIKELAYDYSIPSSGNDIDDIHNITCKAINDYRQMKNELDDTKPLMLKSFLNRFLHGNISERDFTYYHFQNKNELFHKNGFICIKIQMEDCNQFIKENTIEEMQLAKLVILNITEEIFNKEMTAVCIDYDLKNIVLILNISFTDDQEIKNRHFQCIEKLIKECQDIFEVKFKIYTSVGISYINRGIKSLYLCENQAQQALNQKIVSGLYSINYYTEHAAAQNSYSYKLQDEVYLINSVKSGDFDKVKEILDDIMQENSLILLHKQSLITQCFMVDLLSTLLRIVEELSVPTDVININVAQILSIESYTEIIQNIYKYYEILCHWIHKNKKSHNTKMKDKMVSYIENHCFDNSLSLVSVADHMNLNPTYLSVFIKEQLGETFLSYVLNLRMVEAKRLLAQTDLCLQKIAVKIGYANSGVFIRVFKKKFGYTPGTYRNHQKKE